LLEAVRLYRANMWFLLGVAATLAAPIANLNILTTNHSKSVAVIFITLVTSVLSLAASSLLMCALIIGVSHCYLGRRISIRDCYSRAVNGRILWPFLGAQVLRGVIVAGCTLPLFILMFGVLAISRSSGSLQPHVLQSSMRTAICVTLLLSSPWLARLAAVEQSVILEQLGASKAIGRSWSLFGGHVWRLVWIWLPPIILSVAVGCAAGVSHPAWATPALKSAVSSVLGIPLLWPIFAVVQTLVYVDLRARSEDLYIEKLAQHLVREDAVV
jgi:hypothetical protein